MEDYIAVVSHADNKITKYQDFANESDAIAHVSTHGGFVCATPDGTMKYWVVDADKKTLTYDKSTYDSDVASANAVAYKSARKKDYAEIGEQLDQLYHDMTAGKGDKTGNWYAAISKVKSDNPKPE
jgi:hypothetical protein